MEFDDTLQDILDRNIVKVIPSRDSVVFETPFDFSTSYCTFCIFINYWAVRAQLCSPILALTNISPALPSVHDFDAEAIAACDVSAAQCQPMSL